MRALLLLFLASAAFGQADAREQEYYNWCRSQGGTPEGSLSTLHCIPPSGGGGNADGAVIAAPTNIRDAFMLGAMKGLTNVMVQGMQGAIRGSPRAAAPVYGRQQAEQNAAVERNLREQARQRQAEDDAQRQQLQGMLVMPDDAAQQAPPPPAPRPARTRPPKPAAPIADGSVRVDGSTPVKLTGDPASDCRSASKRGSLECLESDAIDVPAPPYLGKDDEAKALAVQKQLIAELDARHEDHDVEKMEHEAGDYLKEQAQSDYEHKGKSYLLGDSGVRVVNVVEGVKDAGQITENYAQKTLSVFRGEGSSAACVLGSIQPNSCWDTYHENARKLETETPSLDRQTATFVAKKFGAAKGWDAAKHQIFGGGAETFYETFR